MSDNGQMWRPPFEPMTLPQLFQRVHEAEYPEEVVLHPIDFGAIAQRVQVVRDPETGCSFFYFCNTKITCKPAKKEVLDLSDRPTRIVVPTGEQQRDIAQRIPPDIGSSIVS